MRRAPIDPGSAVVELGCAPGGWLQVLAERVGPEGRVVGVDLEEVEPLEAPNVVLLRLDFTGADAPERIGAALGRRAAAVLSDAAPKLSGVRDVDRAAQLEIYEGALRVAERVLEPGGSFILKGFPGPETDRFRKLLRERFGRIREVRPEGKRSTSKEFYWIAAPGGGLAARRARRKPRRGKPPAS